MTSSNTGELAAKRPCSVILICVQILLVIIAGAFALRGHDYVTATLLGLMAAVLQLDSLWVDAILGCLVGLLGWYALGYHHVLPPDRIDWLLGPTSREPYYDPGTYFLGWHYFRQSPWTFPLGRNPNYGMEYAGSIAFSDSIPLLALLFKPFNRWMGVNFQYLGIWLLLCFVLQGMFAALLATKLTPNRAARFLITAFFVMAPIMLERSWTEYPLAGHWVLLWAIYLYVRDKDGAIRWTWILLPVLAAATAFYLVPMVMAVWLADAVKRAIRKPREIGAPLIEGACIFGAVWLTMWIIGYFTIRVADAGTPAYGIFALNALGPLDSFGSSLFLMSLPKSPYRVGEGFAYFGFGMILLTPVAMYELARSWVSRRILVRSIPLLLAVIALTAFAMSNKAAFATHVIEVKLPDKILLYCGMFRSSSRMFWVPYYAIWFGVFYLVLRNLKPWLGVPLLLCMLCVQIADRWLDHEAMARTNATYPKWTTPIKDPFWDTAATKYRHIVVFPSGTPVSFVPFDYWGANHGMSTNSAYLGRYPGPKKILPITLGREYNLTHNHLDPETLYVIPEEGRVNQVVPTLHKEHGFGRIDGYNIVAPGWFSDGKAAGPGNLKPGAN